jgi:hypothetical protein
MPADSVNRSGYVTAVSGSHASGAMMPLFQYWKNWVHGRGSFTIMEKDPHPSTTVITAPVPHCSWQHKVGTCEHCGGSMRVFSAVAEPACEYSPQSWSQHGIHGRVRQALAGWLSKDDFTVVHSSASSFPHVAAGTFRSRINDLPCQMDEEREGVCGRFL